MSTARHLKNCKFSFLLFFLRDNLHICVQKCCAHMLTIILVVTGVKKVLAFSSLSPSSLLWFLKDAFGYKTLRYPNITCRVMGVGVVHDVNLIIELRGLYGGKITIVDLTLKKKTDWRIPGVCLGSLNWEFKGKWEKEIYVAQILVSVYKDT